MAEIKVYTNNDVMGMKVHGGLCLTPLPGINKDTAELIAKMIKPLVELTTNTLATLTCTTIAGILSDTDSSEMAKPFADLEYTLKSYLKRYQLSLDLNSMKNVTSVADLNLKGGLNEERMG